MKNDYLTGFLIGLIVILPIIFMLIRVNGVLAPYNILSGCCGWNWMESSTVNNLIPSDVNDFVMPDRVFVKEALLKGEVALWNPIYFGGEVFLANLQSTVLHPVNLFLAVFSVHTVQNISVLGSLFFMTAGMYVFCRKLRLDRLSSAFAGVTYGLMPFAIFWSTFGMMTWSMAIFPFVLTCVLMWHRTKRPHYLAILAILLGLSTFMGHIQFSIVNYILVVFLELAIFLFGNGGVKAKFKDACFVAVFVLAGVLIGAVQLLPFLEQVPLGHRQGTILTDGPDSIAKRIEDIKGFFKVYEFKKAINIEYFLQYAPFHLSIGVIGAVLAVFGAILGVYKKNKTVILLTALFVFGLFWMWGSWPHQILSAISSIFRGLRPTYFISIPLFVAPILAAYGFMYFASGVQSLALALRSRISVESKLLEKIGFIVISMALIGMVLYGIFTTIPNYRIYIGRYDLALYAFLPVIISTVGFLTLPKRYRRFGMVALILYVFFQGTTLFIATQPISPKKLYNVGNPYYETILKDSGETNPHNIRIVYPFSPQTSMFYGIGALNGYDALYAKSTEDLIDAINFPVKTVKYSERSRNAIYVNNTQKENVLKTLGIEYVITDDSRTAPQGYTRIYSGLRNDVYRSINPADQIYFARSVSKSSAAEQLRKIKDGTLGYREVALDAGDESTPQDQDAKVSYDIGINSIEIKTNSDKEQLLFIGQTYRPQWTAIMDGKSRMKIDKANFNFMAIKIPAGVHSIKLTYMPKSYIYGLAITAITSTAMLAYALLPFYRSRRSKR